MNKQTILAAALATILSGCAGLSGQIDQKSEQLAQQTDRLGREVGRVTSLTRQAEPVVIENGFYVGGQKSFRIEAEQQLPAFFKQETWFDAEVADLREFAEKVTRQTNVPVSVMPDAFEVWVGQETKKNSINQSSSTTTSAFASLPPVPGSMAMASGTASQQEGVRPIKFTYTNGSLKGLLDMAAARYGVAWRYAKGEIQFYAYDTKTFFIRAVPGSSALAASVSSDGQGSTSSGNNIAGSNNQTTSVSSELSVWTAISEAVNTMLSEKGKAVISAATGSLTVTDTPEILKRVEHFVESQNGMLSKQVLITVQVLQVSFKDADDYSIEWDLVYNDLFRNYGLKNAISPADGAASLSLGIISPSSEWNGSTAIINALSSQGTVNLQTTASVVALNNQPAPIQTGRQVTYIASSKTTVTQDAGVSTEITPGSVNTGFSMHLLPSIQADGTLFLQFSAAISTLDDLRQLVSADTLIEAPAVAAKTFMQRTRMKSGETLVLSGFEQVDGNLDLTGVGSAKMPILGGGMKAARNKDSLVILVTPVVVGG